MEKVTGELNSPVEFTRIVVPPLSPWITDTVPEDGVIVKSGGTIIAGAVTGARTDGVPAIVTAMSAEWESAPFVAVTMSVYVPVEGELSAVSVRVEDAAPPAGTATGLGRLTETPFGATPVHAVARLTVALKPLMDASTMVVDFETPGVKVTTAGEGWVRKSGFGDVARMEPDGVTISCRVAECDIPPLEAVTVKG